MQPAPPSTQYQQCQPERKPGMLQPSLHKLVQPAPAAPGPAKPWRPHYLPLFPRCSIARIDATLARGSLLALAGGANRFKTAYTVVPASAAAPTLQQAGLAASAGLAPAALRLPPGVASAISFVIDVGAASVLRLFIDGAPAFCAALRDTLFMRAVCAYVEPADGGRWSLLDRIPLAPVGFADDEALMPFTSGAWADCRMLAEYLGFPEKFNFIDIDVATLSKYLAPGARRLTLHLALRDVAPGSGLFAALAPLSGAHLLPACTPVLELNGAPPGGLDEPRAGGGAATLLRTPRAGRRGLLADSLRACADIVNLSNFPQSVFWTRLAGAEVACERVPAEAWLHGRRGTLPVRGVELRMTLDESAFAGGGLHLFAQVVEHCLRRHTRLDNFVRVVLLSKRDGVELLRRPEC